MRPESLQFTVTETLEIAKGSNGNEHLCKATVLKDCNLN